MTTTHQCGLCLLAVLLVPTQTMAHAWHAERMEPAIVFSESYRAKLMEDFMGAHRDMTTPATPASAQTLLASAGGGPAALQFAAMAVSAAGSAPAQAAAFMAFAPQVAVRWDSDFLYIESNGLPAHQMMVGITAWQQQVPLPQAYQGDNAWRIPLHPVVAKQPASIKNRFLRGAIALAANGIPIFNPQNNRGEVSQEIGELDQWGGHCGRADDYHYHAAPLHLQSVVGKGRPIAFALDGYPIYGLTEPDGSPLGRLDGLHGHETSIGYHYHASTKYPYVNGGFHGEVVEADGQVDPQPRASPVREAGAPLRGAKITGFDTLTANSYKLSYEVSGDKRSILYSINPDGTYPFEFNNGRAGTAREVYTKRQGGGGGPREPRKGGGQGGPEEPRKGAPKEGRRRVSGGQEANGPRSASAATKTALPASKTKGSFVLSSPAVANGGTYPVEYTGDGAGSTPPLAWTGAPAGTKSYALIMHHLDPEGVTKWYWTLYNLPPDLTHLDKNTQGVGTLGSSFKGKTGYEPPHSKGPGPKTYVITLYALSAAPKFSEAASQVTGEVLSAALKDRVLASADLSVVYSRGGAGEGTPGGGKPPPKRESEGRPAPPTRAYEASSGPAGPEGGQRKPWLQQHGAEMDANHDGAITLAEAADDMNRAFAIYDRNHDGIISAEELKTTGDVREGAAFAGLIYRHFAELDTNGDGSVSRDEMIASVKYIFNAADLDHDGKVTTAEWQSAPNTPLPIRADVQGGQSGPSN